MGLISHNSLIILFVYLLNVYMHNIYKKLPEIPQHIIDLPILNYEEIKKEIEK